MFARKHGVRHGRLFHVRLRSPFGEDKILLHRYVADIILCPIRDDIIPLLREDDRSVGQRQRFIARAVDHGNRRFIRPRTAPYRQILRNMHRFADGIRFLQIIVFDGDLQVGKFSADCYRQPVFARIFGRIGNTPDNGINTRLARRKTAVRVWHGSFSVRL